MSNALKRKNHNSISGVKSRTNPDIDPNGGGGGGGWGGGGVYPRYNDRCITSNRYNASKGLEEFFDNGKHIFDVSRC